MNVYSTLDCQKIDDVAISIGRGIHEGRPPIDTLFIRVEPIAKPLEVELAHLSLTLPCSYHKRRF